ncbi:MAG: hypothetical protein ACOYOB_17200, partial [Myxococcota bacterium]
LSVWGLAPARRMRHLPAPRAEDTAMTDKKTPAPLDAAALGPAQLLSRNSLLTIGGIIAALWLIAAVSGHWIVTTIMAVLTLAILGGLFWLYRLARKQRDVMSLLQGAGASPEARAAALLQLQAKDGGSKDVIHRIARAQLEAQTDPDKAILTLEGIDLKKIQAAAADEVRALLGQLYLWKGRVSEARTLADDIKLANAGNGQSRALMIAVQGESWARTGKHEAALELLNDLKLDDPELAQIRVPLLMARVFATYACGKREKTRKDLMLLMKEDVNLLGRFVSPGQKVHPELQKIAREVLAAHPDMKRMQRQQQNPYRRVR